MEVLTIHCQYSQFIAVNPFVLRRLFLESVLDIVLDKSSTKRKENRKSQSKGLRQIHGFLHTLPKWKYSPFIAVNPFVLRRLFIESVLDIDLDNYLRYFHAYGL